MDTEVVLHIPLCYAKVVLEISADLTHASTRYESWGMANACTCVVRLFIAELSKQEATPLPHDPPLCFVSVC